MRKTGYVEESHPEFLEFASFRERAAAFLIDEIISFSLIIPFFVLIFLVHLDSLIGYGYLIFLFFCLYPLYFILGWTKFHGHTIGKKLMGIRVVMEDGR
ncbi:MAG: RDD family protein [Patescibacteria group bacterium]|nr:RDD family protein [Patescibacteria group bacterium]